MIYTVVFSYLMLLCSMMVVIPMFFLRQGGVEADGCSFYGPVVVVKDGTSLLTLNFLENIMVHTSIYVNGEVFVAKQHVDKEDAVRDLCEIVENRKHVAMPVTCGKTGVKGTLVLGEKAINEAAFFVEEV